MHKYKHNYTPRIQQNTHNLHKYTYTIAFTDALITMLYIAPLCCKYHH